MDENHQDKIESKLVVTEDVKWQVNRKSKLWVPKHKKRTGFQGKTLWDCLDLIAKLAIPIVVVLATIAFGWWQVHLADLQHQSDQKLAQQQHASDQQSALDQQRATILQTYIANIQDLLLNHDLLKSNPGDDVAILARARTLTALQGLDQQRKGRLVQFIYEAKLIGFFDAGLDKNNLHGIIIDLGGANLSGANLDEVNLSGANLSGTNLAGAILSFANLRGANLTMASFPNANLIGTNLINADLLGATLYGADLGAANLEGANLGDANLSGDDLSWALLDGAYLGDADLNGADLSDANHLTQQQLDEVYSCIGAILPKGLTCHHNQ